MIAVVLLLSAALVAAQTVLPPLPNNCLIVDDATKTIKSDPDGPGPQLYPAQNCTALITCPNTTGVVITVTGEATGTAYFTLKPFRVLLGTTVSNVFPAWNFHQAISDFRTSYDSSQLIIQFLSMTPQDSDRTGGFELTWDCVTVCPSTLPNPIPTTSSGVVTDAVTSGVNALVCVRTLQAPTCPVGWYASYDFLQRPVGSPRWVLAWLQTPTPGIIMFPNSANATEQYLVPRDVTVELRAEAVNTPVLLNWTVRYYCTPVAILPIAGMPAGSPAVPLGPPYGAILSDADGEGPIPYPSTSVQGTWNISCPYDTNVATTEISAIFGTQGQQVLTMTPVLGAPSVRRDQIVNYRDIPWGSPSLSVNFASPTNQNSLGRGGFTVKYECSTQCALGPPTRVSGPSPLNLARSWNAAQPFADMCRWEVDTACQPGENVRVNVLKAPIASETFKLILDYDTEWFKFVYPDKKQGKVLHLRGGPFNASVRAFNGSFAGFELNTTCEASGICGESWGSTTLLGAVGTVASDYDGFDVYPYTLGSGCTYTIACPGPMTVSFQGVLDAADVLTVLAAGSPWQTLTGTFANAGLSVTGPLSVSLQGGSTGPVEGGFTLSYTCLATTTPSSGPPAPTPTTVAPPPTTVAPPPTTVAPPPVTTTTVTPATTTLLPTNSPTPLTTQAPPPLTTPSPAQSTTAAPPRTTLAPPRGRRTRTHTLPFVFPAAAAAPDEGTSAGAMVGIIVGSIVGALLLCLIIALIVLRAKKLSVREAYGQFFHDPGKYTKGFELKGDEELEALTGERANNDMLANEDLLQIGLLPATAAAAPAPVVRTKSQPKPQSPQPQAQPRSQHSPAPPSSHQVAKAEPPVPSPRTNAAASPPPIDASDI
jgi:hypothetical protein